MLKQGDDDIYRITCDYCGKVLEESKKKSELHDEEYYNRKLWGEEKDWEKPRDENIALLEGNSRNFHFCCKSDRDAYFRKVYQAWRSIEWNSNILTMDKMPLRCWANTRHIWDIPACKWDSYAYLIQPKEQIQFNKSVSPSKDKLIDWFDPNTRWNYFHELEEQAKKEGRWMEVLP